MDYIKEQNNKNIDFFILVFIIASVYTYVNTKKDDRHSIKFTFKNQQIIMNLVDKKDEELYVKPRLEDAEFEVHIDSEESFSSSDEELYEPLINNETPVVKIISPSKSYKQSIQDMDLDHETEVINNEYYNESNVVNLLQNLQHEGDTLDESRHNSEKTEEIEDIFTLHPSSSKVLINDETQFDNSTIKTIVSAGFDDFNTHNNNVDYALSTLDSREQQQPVKLLIKKFETISSASSVNSGENSFINKNILNKANTKSNETLKSAIVPILNYEDRIEVVENAIPKQPLNPELKTPVKRDSISDTISVHSKDSFNSNTSYKFFTPLIERNNGRGLSISKEGGSNFLKFKSGNENINFNDLTTSSISKSVLTQEICATATIVLPEIVTSKAAVD